MTAVCAVWLARDFLHRAGRPIDIPPCGCTATECPPISEGALMTTDLRRRVQDTDGVVFTEHPSGRWVMEADPDSYRRLIDTWDSYEQLLGDAVELTELEPAPAYTTADLDAA